MRFSVYEAYGDEWMELDDCSYCTQIPANLPINVLRQMAGGLLGIFEDAYAPGKSLKKLGETVSWVSPEWFERQGGASVPLHWPHLLVGV